MEIVVDGETREIDIEGIETVKDLIAYLELELVKPPRVIIRIVLNEEELDEAQEVGLGAFPVQDVVSLALVTADRGELAHEALRDAQEYLPILSSVLEQSAILIRQGNIRDGLKQASEALEIISAFGEVLDGIRGAFRLDFAEVAIDDFNLLEKLNQLGSNASDILKSVQDEDWTQFADLLEYELSPLLYEWMAVIPELVKLLPGSERAGEKEGG